jgi:hypothetical protein
VWNIPSGLEIMHNSIRESKYYGIALWPGANNAAVHDNKFIDIEDNWAGILVRGNGNYIDNNDYKDSKLRGWTSDTDGSGAIVLTGESYDNIIHEMNFPEGQGVMLCQMILDLTDDPFTTEYDGTNEIHNYQPCENLAKRDINLMEIEANSRHRIPIVDR